MTINKAIERADSVRPNAYGDELKFAWLAELDGKIAIEVMKIAAPDYSLNCGDTSLLVGAPYDNVYELYLFAMIDFQNREYSNYQSSSALYMAAYDDFARHYLRTNMPVANRFTNVI